ncbi:Flotillin-2 [Desmophyllum pertusum]|uniref:Flotillin-2 n=1 Tax=Desmophyllum pertusum TaxID=174260 RepID=A0A9X0CSM8_9CNID|nr:Flotillin-2 [Desmophyllum pertusum]
MGNCHMASDREAVVVSGGCCIPRTQKYKAVAGKYKCLWAWAGLSKVDRLTLDVLTFKKVFKKVKTARGYHASVSILAEVQVMQDLQHFARASDYFLGKTKDEIADVLLNVLEAHLRDIYELIALKCIEEDANHFSERVQKAATPDVWDLGVLIHNFFITDVAQEELI